MGTSDKEPDFGDFIQHGLLCLVGIPLVIVTAPFWLTLWALGYICHKLGLTCEHSEGGLM